MTSAYQATNNLWKTFTAATIPYNEVNWQRYFVTDVSSLLKIPFGLSYSCYWGFSVVLIDEDPWEDGVLTQEEELELLITLSNKYVTNIFFNMGYIYQDIFSLTRLSTTDKNYYRNLGIYLGDVLIRFFWRRRFTRNFEYPTATA